MKAPLIAVFRRHLLVWGFALLLPMPALLGATDSGGIALVYLSLGAALLAGEIFRPAGVAESSALGRVKFIALAIYTSANAAIFSVLGSLTEVRSNIPLPLLATLSTIPSVGLVPWLTIRCGKPYVAIVLVGVAALGIKLAACVAARIVYGPDFIALGYVADDWRTAKLMISIFWGGMSVLSIAGLIGSSRSIARHEETAERAASADSAL